MSYKCKRRSRVHNFGANTTEYHLPKICCYNNHSSRSIYEFGSIKLNGIQLYQEHMTRFMCSCTCTDRCKRFSLFSVIAFLDTNFERNSCDIFFFRFLHNKEWRLQSLVYVTRQLESSMLVPREHAAQGRRQNLSEQ